MRCRRFCTAFPLAALSAAALIVAACGGGSAPKDRAAAKRPAAPSRCVADWNTPGKHRGVARIVFEARSPDVAVVERKDGTCLVGFDPAACPDGYTWIRKPGRHWHDLADVDGPGADMAFERIVLQGKLTDRLRAHPDARVTDASGRLVDVPAPR